MAIAYRIVIDVEGLDKMRLVAPGIPGEIVETVLLTALANLQRELLARRVATLSPGTNIRIAGANELPPI